MSDTKVAYKDLEDAVVNGVCVLCEEWDDTCTGVCQDCTDKGKTATPSDD